MRDVDYLPNSSLLRPREVVNGPGVAAGEDGIEANARYVNGKVAHCNVILDGFCFGEENGICDYEQGLCTRDKRHTPCESVGKERGD